ncbi:hypothetical protein SLS62_005883 [Diatrype stigma]|uniref:Glycoside hydrolase family 92 protein n=1 Tax=Diatrype stigma TaxID=117547 RepID=A0AAN9UNE4_9PEZI
MRSSLSHGLAALLTAHFGVSFAQVDYSQYVNPFMGGLGPFEGLAFGGGDIFVGGALPFGVVKMGIDTWEQNISFATLNGGWTPGGLVMGISMMHEHGTGGAPKYGLVAQMPLTTLDDPVNILDNTTYWQERVGDDVASVGYYKTEFANSITVELSGARHAGIVQYTFPENSSEKHVLVDVSHYIPAPGDDHSSQMFLGGEIAVDGAQYTGYTTTGGGFGQGAPFTVYFCGEFDSAPQQARTFRGRNTDPMARYHTFSNGPIGQAVFSAEENSTKTTTKETSGPMNDRVGAVFSFDSSHSDDGSSSSSRAVVRSRIGISFISTEKACSFKDSEIASWDLNDTVTAAVDEWNRDVFSRIQVPTDDESANRTNLALLYSSLYFAHLMPSDRTGENPLWESDEPSWDDFYALWDTFRCTVSLYHLIQPAAYESQIRSLIDIWRHEGYMPDTRSGNWNGLVQGGSDADNVLADAYVKGLRGAIDWAAGYQAMVKNAEVTPYNTFTVLDPSASVKEGRGALDDWKRLGYVSTDNTRCISRTVEYSANDYALSVVAAGEAPDDVAKYRNRSAGWQRSWNPDIESVGFRGFLTPRNSSGAWDDEGYNPAQCGRCSWTSITYEATPWEYSFSIPHDMETVIELMGGAAEFERRLDYIFQPNTSQQNLGANGAAITSIMNIGYLANQYFHDEMHGLPGNSDAGALNSWLIWQMLGIYPIVTQPVYLIESPWFTDINMTINGNATLRITSNGDAQSLGYKAYYVQSVKINGQEWSKNWFNHEDIMISGGTIEFTVGDEPKIWESGEVPPSPGHVNTRLFGN